MICVCGGQLNIFHTVLAFSFGLSLVLVDTIAAFFCGFVNHTLCIHISLKGDLSTRDISKRGLGDPAEKGPRISESVMPLVFTTQVTHIPDHMTLSSWKKSPVITRSDVERFLPWCVTHSHPACL